MNGIQKIASSYFLQAGHAELMSKEYYRHAMSLFRVILDSGEIYKNFAIKCSVSLSIINL